MQFTFDMGFIRGDRANGIAHELVRITLLYPILSTFHHVIQH